MLVHLRWAIVLETCMYAARIHLRWANVLIEGARRPSATPLAFGPLIDPLVVLKLLDVARKHKFLPSEPYCLAPWWSIKNHNICLCSLTKVPSCKIHAKFMPEKL